MVWTPPDAEKAYYSIPAPADKASLFSQLFGSSSPADPTYGRAALPRSPVEEDLYAKYNHRDGRVATSDKEWIAYQVWEAKAGDAESKHADLLFIHGINDYGGKFATHASIFLDAGYRVIVPDLPSHGRSTGIHCYCPSMDALADSIYLVLADVLLEDSRLVKNEDGGFKQTRKIFVAGQSLGGFVSALTCLKYGSDETTDRHVAASVKFRPLISGGVFLCPMLAISADTRPAYVVELVARGLSSFAGVLPLAAANKGRNSEDPSVEDQFEADPQTYHGKLRVGTGLAILKGLEDINNLFPHLKIPFSIHHGTSDRVTSYHGSEKLYKEAVSTDKELKLYEGFEHILLRKGCDEADDARRQRVLGDMLDWLYRH